MSDSVLDYMSRAFKHRNYRLFFVGQFVSMSGSWMQTVALSWLVYRLTGSAALLGTVAFVGQLPVTIFSTYGGAIADRYNRRKILYWTQIASMILALVLGVLTLTNSVQVWEVIAISVAFGFSNVFELPARQAFVSDLVPKEDLRNAIALNTTLFHGSRVVGPAIAGLLIGWIGEGWCFLVNALSFVGVIVVLVKMEITLRMHAPKGSTWESMLEGIRYVIHHPQIRAILALVATTSLFTMSYMVLMPIFADQILHQGAKGMGTLMALSGVGAVFGALYLASRKSKPQEMLRSVGIFSMAFNLVLLGFAFSQKFWLSAVLIIPIGFLMVSQMATSNTIVQSIAPDRLRGRVMALFAMMFMGIMPFGALVAGHVAHHIGPAKTVGIDALAGFLAGTIFFWRLGMSKVNLEHT